MHTTRFLLPFFALSLLAACSTSTVAAPAGPVGVTPLAPTHPGVLAPSRGALETCLAGGGGLVELHTVNNDDTTDHGEVVTFAISGDRTLAVAGADGSVKFWTLDGFVGVAGGPTLTYGPAIATPVAADLAWTGADVAVGDVSGLVTAYDTAGTANVLGGVEPGTAIAAVAASRDRTRLAHADVRAGGHVTVRTLGGTDVVGPLAATLDTVRDLAFLPDGTLLVAGGLGAPWPPASVVERWDATPGAPVQLVRYQAAGTEFVGVATSASGDVVAAASADRVVVLDAALHERAAGATVGAGTVGLDVGTDGAFVFTAGADGVLRVLEASTATETARFAVSDPVAVRIDPAGELVFVASRAGLVHALACR